MRVQVEKDEANEKFIRTVASRVQEHGPRFEAMIREKERENPRFAFLRDDKVGNYPSSLFNVGRRLTFCPFLSRSFPSIISSRCA